jgi:hypothetical protein
MKCEKCFGKNKEDRQCDIAIPPCPNCKGTGEQPKEEVIKPCQHLLNTIDDPKKAICMKCGEEFAIAY